MPDCLIITTLANEFANELEKLLAEIDTLQKAQLQSRIETRYIERYQIFLALGLAAFVASELIPDRLVQHISPSWTSRLWRKRQSKPTDSTPSWVSQ